MQRRHDILLVALLLVLGLGECTAHGQPVITRENMCKHQGVLEIFSMLRRTCLNGNCDIDQLLREVDEKFGKEHFTTIPAVLPNMYTVFFFPRGKDMLDTKKIQDKINTLRRIIGPMVETPENTVVFVLGKASGTHGTAKTDIALSSRRTNFIAKLIIAQGNINRCSQVYRSYVGQERFLITKEEADQIKYGTQADWEKRPPGELLEYYINQSVLVAVYPCFKEMCRYMKDVKKLPCAMGPGPVPGALPEECNDVVCKQ